MERTQILRWLVLWRVLALVLPVTLITGCQSSGQKFADVKFAGIPGSVPIPSVPDPSTYATNRLTEGDVVSISFQYSTNFNALQKIALDGTLNLDSVGLVKAAGKTPLQLQEELAKLYKPQVKDDVLTVKIVASASSIYISGAVVRPGKVPLDRPMTVLEGIMEAGGFDPNRAKLSSVRVIRLEDGRQKIYIVDVQKVLEGKGEGTGEAPFYLKPFDIVHVPLKTFNF
jgi:polysaccharide export outer membrane protein